MMPFSLGRFCAGAVICPASMQPLSRAVMDVCTNSVKLLVANVTNQRIEPVLEKSSQTRLGRGLYETHLLQPAAIEETAQAVARFASLAVQAGAANVRLIATSAAREAR